MPTLCSRARTFATAAVAAALAASSPIQAQPRTFDACVYGPFQTCSSFRLETTPIAPFTDRLFPLGGTAVDVFVRQTTLSARPTGLSALSFFFPLAIGIDAAAAPVSSLTAEGGVPPAPTPPRWLSRGTSTQVDLLHDPSVEPGVPAGTTQYVAGCAGGQFSGALLTTALVTCGPGGYRFQFSTAAQFLAAHVTGFGLELYAGTDADAPNGRTVSCTFDSVTPLDGVCIDPANLSDPLVPFGPPVAMTPVPEPATVGLVGVGLLALAAAVRRRR